VGRDRHTDRLRDRKCRAEGNELYRDKEKDVRFAHTPEWLVVWRHRAVREEVNNLLGNAVSRELIEAHVPAKHRKTAY
jgi:hypothetical protein